VTAPLLEVEGLEAGYGDVLVLHGVGLRAERDEVVAIIGPNGAGKSTLLKAVYGLVKARAGSVRLAGEEIVGVRPDRLTRRGLNLVPQLDNVFPSLSIAENLKVSALAVPRALNVPWSPPDVPPTSGRLITSPGTFASTSAQMSRPPGVP